MSAPPPLPPRRLLLRIGGGGCGGGSSGNSCSSSSRLAANFQLDDVCSSENLNPCSTPTPFNKNSKKRRRNHVNDINNCAIIGGGERGDAGKIIKGDDYDNEDNEVVVGILKTAPNSPNINTNKKNPNTIATTLSNNIPRTPAFDLSDAALSKLGVTTKNTINHGVTTKNTINHNQISFKATPASTATGTGSGRRSRNSVAAAAFAAFTGASTMSGLANTRGVQRFSSAKSNMIVTRSSSRVV